VQRARIIRLIADLDLRDLAPDLHASLDALASEERAGAARAVGKLHDQTAMTQLHALLDDPTEDVREAAQASLESLARPPVPRSGAVRAQRTERGTWSVGASTEEELPVADWQALLRTHFGASEDVLPAASPERRDDDGK
jgi:HEAT repeat protein